MTDDLVKLAEAWVDAKSSVSFAAGSRSANPSLDLDGRIVEMAIDELREARTAFLTAARHQAARIAELEAENLTLRNVGVSATEQNEALRAENARLREALENLGAAAYFVLTESNGIDDNVWTLSDGSKVEWDYPIESFRRAIKWLNAAWEAAGGVRRRPESRAARAAESEER
jgi:FtsZ-binding cell division protein ZapB